MSKLQDLIRRVHIYRPRNHTGLGTSLMLLVKKLPNFPGQKETVIVLQNGKEVPEEDIYTENFGVDTGDSKPDLSNKVKFFIVSDETDFVQIGVPGCEQTIEFHKSDIEFLLEGLQSFHHLIQDPDSSETIPLKDDQNQKLNSVPTNSRTIKK